MTNTTAKATWGRKGMISSYSFQVTVHQWGTSVQEPMGGHCRRKLLTGLHPTAYSACFLYNLGPPVQSGTIHSGWGFFTSIVNQENVPRIAYKTIWLKHLLNWSSAFLSSQMTLACVKRTTLTWRPLTINSWQQDLYLPVPNGWPFLCSWRHWFCGPVHPGTLECLNSFLKRNLLFDPVYSIKGFCV